ncbi:hypothetical protein M406DRAFT_75026 [Cryphonectria parasitica EP155]|uniref:Uncharacterized protein n=1 Tax=Cryphonectria parasitica (strain ATCC 38755 / EP155) TaxID=660469 RepID=A0A9P5CM59_CRYP1|nr:uncharacterized protein M406DRAFT_75026 [Cryphonectria parasitica EP155]KAF3763788.1 hypothetical protein M406DRAFT_75026 [Cryphonectria parasitica EP155]
MDSLVFSEHVVHAVSNLKDLDWDLGDPEPRDWLGFQLARDHGFTRPKNHRPEWPAKGPRSLFMLALETAAKNIQNIDDYWLESIAKPEWIKMMWRYLRPEDGDLSRELSLAAWKKFNKFLPDDPEWGTQLAFNYKQIRVPTAADFAIYTKPLTSTASFDFVAHLRISGLCPIKPQNLILLAGLKNLGVLEVIEQFDAAASFPGAVSDRVVRI